MRGSRVKRLRSYSNPKPGRINGGTIGFEARSPNERARRQQILLSLHAGDNSEESSSKNETSEELHDDGNVEFYESDSSPYSGTDSEMG